MRDQEQARIFAKNIRRYISASGKAQKDIAKDLGFNPTTFNTWCVGKVMPSLGKVQAIADYFHIGKTDLLEEKQDGNDGAIVLSEFEAGLILAYRSAADSMKEAVNVLLGVTKKGSEEQERDEYSA